jgi:hypothetical protein
LVRVFVTVHACLFFSIISSFCIHSDSYAQSAEEIKKQLFKKGFTEEILSLLTPRCLESLNRKLPAETVWYATYDRDAKSVTVDFQTGVKAVHNTLTVVSLKNGGCMTVQDTIIMNVGPCKVEAESWMNLYKKRGITLKIEEESPKRIYLSTEGNLGVKIFLYTAGNLCMVVYRNVETVK